MKTLLFSFGLMMLSLSQISPAIAKLEIIDLRHRSANEMIPLVKPFLSKDGVVTGKDYKLIIRTDEANLKDIKQLVNRFDTALRRLLITVSQERHQGGQKYGGHISGSAGSGDIHIGTGKRTKSPNDGIRAKIYSTQTRDEQFATQRVQTVEGQSAFIEVGKLVPQGQREITTQGRSAIITDSVTLQPVTTGFYVTPRISGDNVILDISQHAQSESRHGGGKINIQSAQTQVTGKLGKWIEVGGAERTHSGTSSGIIYSTGDRSQQNRSIYLKVEEVK